MLIDCDSCAVRGNACHDCVIGVLLDAPAARADVDHPKGAAAAGTETPSTAPAVQLDAGERRALEVLADHGLVPRLRLMAPTERQTPHDRAHRAAERDVG